LSVFICLILWSVTVSLCIALLEACSYRHTPVDNPFHTMEV
jgi:hypothetical protein